MDRSSSGRVISGSPVHLTQLDGVRALAVCGVIVQHYLGRFGNSNIPAGSIGVRVFFVLSGFLITGILLRERRNCDQLVDTPLSAAYRFYARRVLRIFPLYYMVLAVAVLVNVTDIRSRWGWQAGYLSNVFYALHPDQVGREAHFWSLSVEEQFYIFWPWVILLIPRGFLKPFLLITIASGPLFRIAMIACGGSRAAVELLTPACADALGMGALLAMVSDPVHGRPALRERLLRIAGWASLILLPPAVLLATSVTGHLRTRFPWLETAELVSFTLATSFLGLWIVGRCVDGIPGSLGRLLNHPTLNWVGVRSYGVYVYHFFMPAVVLWALQTAHLSSSHALSNLIAAPLTFIVAAASWALFERPLNDLKRFFPYEPRGKLRREPSVDQPSIASPKCADATV